MEVTNNGNDELKEKTPLSFEDQVVQDFYQSFRFSGGDMNVQKYLFTFLARQYKRKYFSDGSMPDFYLLNSRLKREIPGFLKPVNHINVSDRERLEMFRQMWTIEKSTLEHAFGVENGRPLQHWETGSDLELMGRFADELADSEIKQMDPKFNILATDSRDHLRESRLRRLFVLGKVTTLPLSFREIFENTQSLLADLNILNPEQSPERIERAAEVPLDMSIKRSIRDRYVELANVWESNHPGQQFFSSSS